MKGYKIDHICSCGGFGSQFCCLLTWLYAGNGRLKINFANKCTFKCAWSKLNTKHNIFEIIFEKIEYKNIEYDCLPELIYSNEKNNIKNSVCYNCCWELSKKQKSLTIRRQNIFDSINFRNLYVEHNLKGSLVNNIIYDTKNIVRKSLSDTYYKYLKPKKKIIDKINKYLKFYENNFVVGIHIRSSQHYEKLAQNNVRTKDIVTSICREILKMKKKNRINKYSKFFIATSNINILEKVKKMLGFENLIFIDTYRDNNTIYENNQQDLNKNDWTKETNNIKKYGVLNYTIDIFIDIFLLSKCNLLIGGESNITSSALILNPNLNFLVPSILKNTNHK